jgi:phage-related minor tail protein
MTQIDGITVAIDADTSSFRREIANADKLAKGFGTSIASALAGASARGRDFGSVLQSLAMRLGKLALSAAFKSGGGGLGGLFGSLFSKPGDPSADVSSSVTPFAEGGVIATPTFFPLGNRLGLAGERGAEAILPLARGADGRLGVRAGGSDGRPLAVTVNVQTPDAASFRRSEAYLAGSIARAVARGERSL